MGTPTAGEDNFNQSRSRRADDEARKTSLVLGAALTSLPFTASPHPLSVCTKSLFQAANPARARLPLFRGFWNCLSDGMSNAFFFNFH
jgi:hypothetical protein